jgi:hypothetical protein
MMDLLTMRITNKDNKIVAVEFVQASDRVLRLEVHRLADKAFRYHFISGYGEIEDSGEYQIVYKGRPKYLALRNARAFLLNLMGLPESSHKSL